MGSEALSVVLQEFHDILTVLDENGIESKSVAIALPAIIAWLLIGVEDKETWLKALVDTARSINELFQIARNKQK